MAGTLVIDTLKASSGVLATQNGMTGICKAWINFMGVASPTITGSFNVSSLTRQSAGVYVVAFTTAMPNANYAAFAGGSPTYGGAGTGSNIIADSGSVVQTASQFGVITRYSTSTNDFGSPVSACVFA